MTDKVNEYKMATELNIQDSTSKLLLDWIKYVSNNTDSEKNTNKIGTDIEVFRCHPFILKLNLPKWMLRFLSRINSKWVTIHYFSGVSLNHVEQSTNDGDTTVFNCYFKANPKVEYINIDLEVKKEK